MDWLCAAGGRSARWSGSTGERRPRTTWSPPTGGTTRSPSSGRARCAGVPTHLSRFMVVDPLALAAEADHLARWACRPVRSCSPSTATRCSPRRGIAAANQARELARGGGPARLVRHGRRARPWRTPWTTADAPRVGDVLVAAPGCARRLRARSRRRARAARRAPPRGRRASTRSPAFGRAVSDRGLRRTWPAAAPRAGASSRARRACCWTSGAASTRTRPGPPPRSPTRRTLLRRSVPCGSGVVRTYTTRHGAGPLVTEDPALRRCPSRTTAPGRGRARSGSATSTRSPTGTPSRWPAASTPWRVTHLDARRAPACGSARRTSWTACAGTRSGPARRATWPTRPR